MFYVDARSVSVTGSGNSKLNLGPPRPPYEGDSPCHAPAPPLTHAAGPYALYTVPGVINEGNLGTYFPWTSTDTAPQTVSLELFNLSAVSVGNANYALGPKNSIVFGTRIANGFTANFITSGTPASGSAEISSTSKKLICGAFVADAVNSTPTSMTSMTIVSKHKQKGD